MKKKLLSPEQAFQAMFVFLDAYGQRTVGATVLADILGDIQLNETDHRPADPATWDDWFAAIDAVLAEGAGAAARSPARRQIP